MLYCQSLWSELSLKAKDIKVLQNLYYLAFIESEMIIWNLLDCNRWNSHQISSFHCLIEVEEEISFNLYCSPRCPHLIRVNSIFHFRQSLTSFSIQGEDMLLEKHISAFLDNWHGGESLWILYLRIWFSSWDL